MHHMREQMGPVNGGEALREFLDSLDRPVIVEGRRDEEALVRLGVDSGLITVINRGQSLLETVEALQGSGEVIILTDMDRAGKGLRRRLLGMFSQYGISEKTRPRELFARLRVGNVEGL
jgi:5S rRNA maturation endonuclease (ribonuclease M5)